MKTLKQFLLEHDNNTHSKYCNDKNYIQIFKKNEIHSSSNNEIENYFNQKLYNSKNKFTDIIDNNESNTIKVNKENTNNNNSLYKDYLYLDKEKSYVKNNNSNLSLIEK